MRLRSSRGRFGGELEGRTDIKYNVAIKLVLSTSTTNISAWLSNVKYSNFSLRSAI